MVKLGTLREPNGFEANNASSSPSSVVGGKVKFGCGSYESGLILSQKADGILGMSKSKFSLINQLASSNKISNTFSICSSQKAGILKIGDASLPRELCKGGLIRVPYAHNRRIRRKHLYAIALKSMHVGDTLFTKQKRAVILDTGSTMSYLPESMHSAFVSLLEKMIPAGAGRVGRGSNVCYAPLAPQGGGRSSPFEDFPALTLSFGTQMDITLPPHAYLFPQVAPYKGQRTKMYCPLFQRQGKGANEIHLGSVMLENFLLVFEDRHVSLAPCDCSSLASNQTVRAMISQL